MKMNILKLKKKPTQLNIGHWVIILSIIGIIILYLISTQTKPKEISISEVEKYEGKYVIVEGIVIDEYTTKSKGKLITIREDNSSVLVFIEKSSLEIEIGDEIRVEGKVQKYQDDYEIVVLSDKSIEILEHWTNKKISLKQLSNNPDKYIGININITGYVIYVDKYETNISFYLTDSVIGGNYSLKIIGCSINSIVQNITDGDFVIVKGKFEYDDYSLRYIINVSEKEHCVFYFTE